MTYAVDFYKSHLIGYSSKRPVLKGYFQKIFLRTRSITTNEMQCINGFTSFMRGKSTHKGKIAYTRHICSFLPHKETMLQKFEERNYFVLMGFLVRCHVFPQGIKKLN